MSRILDYVLEPNVVYTNGAFLIKVKVQDDYKYKKYLVSENMKYTTATGTTFTLTNAVSTNNSSILQLEGNTTQNGTPTPTSPVEVKTVSGDNNIVVSNEQHVTGNSYRVDLGGKNKFNYANTTITNSGITTTYNNGEISYSGTATTTYANLTDVTSLSLPVGTYTFSREGTNNVKLTLRVWSASNVRTDYNINANSNSTTFTISEKTDRTYLFLAGLTANTQYSGSIKVQLEKRKCSYYF